MKSVESIPNFVTIVSINQIMIKTLPILIINFIKKENGKN